MRQQLRIGSRGSWVVAWLFAVAAPVAYLLWPSSVLWWVALGLVMPLVGLSVWRHERNGFTADPSVSVDNGPWAPPPAP